MRKHIDEKVNPFYDFKNLPRNERTGFWVQGSIPLGALEPNRTVTWSGTDTLAHFKTGKTNGYSEDDVSYVANRFGYRSVDFEPGNLSDKKKVMFLGCSFTKGIGVPIQEVWTTRLVDKLNTYYDVDIKCHNFGIGGAGNDAIAMTAVQAVPVIKPDLACVLFAGRARRQFFWDYDLRELFVAGGSSNPRIMNGYLKAQTEAGDWYEFVRCYQMVSLVMAANNIPWVWGTWDWMPSNARLYVDMDINVPMVTGVDRARDNGHWGRMTNEALADNYLDRIITKGLFNPN